MSKPDRDGVDQDGPSSSASTREDSPLPEA